MLGIRDVVKVIAKVLKRATIEKGIERESCAVDIDAVETNCKKAVSVDDASVVNHGKAFPDVVTKIFI